MKQLRSGSPNYLYISGMLVMFDALSNKFSYPQEWYVYV